MNMLRGYLVVLVLSAAVSVIGVGIDRRLSNETNTAIANATLATSTPTPTELGKHFDVNSVPADILSMASDASVAVASLTGVVGSVASSLADQAASRVAPVPSQVETELSSWATGDLFLSLMDGWESAAAIGTAAAGNYVASLSASTGRSFHSDTPTTYDANSTSGTVRTSVAGARFVVSLLAMIGVLAVALVL